MKTNLMPEPTKTPVPPKLPGKAPEGQRQSFPAWMKVGLFFTAIPGLIIVVVIMGMILGVILDGVKSGADAVGAVIGKAGDAIASTTMPRLDDGFYYTVYSFDEPLVFEGSGIMVIRDMKTQGYATPGLDEMLDELIIPINRPLDLTKQFNANEKLWKESDNSVEIHSSDSFTFHFNKTGGMIHWVKHQPGTRVDLRKTRPRYKRKWSVLGSLGNTYYTGEVLRRQLDFALPLVPAYWIEADRHKGSYWSDQNRQVMRKYREYKESVGEVPAEPDPR